LIPDLSRQTPAPGFSEDTQGSEFSVLQSAPVACGDLKRSEGFVHLNPPETHQIWQAWSWLVTSGDCQLSMCYIDSLSIGEIDETSAKLGYAVFSEALRSLRSLHSTVLQRTPRPWRHLKRGFRWWLLVDAAQHSCWYWMLQDVAAVSLPRGSPPLPPHLLCRDNQGQE
jgi:hypothetical protein